MPPLKFIIKHWRPLLLAILLLCINQHTTIAQTDSLIPIKRGKKFGYHNKNGTKAINYIYDFAGKFEDGLARVKKKNKWGFIDKKNNAIIPLVYDTVSKFYEERAAVKKNGIWGYVNKSGTIEIDLKYSEARNFHNGLAIVATDSLYGFINTVGSVIIEPKYLNLINFSEQRAGAKRESGWGFISLIGKEFTNFTYDSVGFFQDSIAPVKKNDKWGYVDYNGNLIVDFVYIILKKRNEDYNLPWFYADYCALMVKATKKESKNKLYYQHLNKAVSLLEYDSDYFSLTELKKMKYYYKRLGKKQKRKEYRRKIRQKKHEEHVNIYNRPKVTMDVSVATEPLIVEIDINDLKKLPPLPPLYAEWRIGIIGIGARYLEQNNFTDKWRFGAWREIPNWPQKQAWHTYDATLYSAFLKFYKQENIGKAIYGYGHSGQYYGLEYRRHRYEFQPFTTIISDNDGYTFYAEPNPVIPSHDISLIVGYSRSKGLFYFDAGISLGYGRREIKLQYPLDQYTYQDQRWDEKRIYPYYFPARFNLRIGINIF